MAGLNKTETKLIYACSGAADVGEIADRVARKLRSEGAAKMTCLAGIGAGLSAYVKSAKDADVNIAIDGCPVACAKNTLAKIGVTPTSYILTDMGLIKGETPVTEKIIKQLADKIKNTQDATEKQAQIGTCGCSCGSTSKG
jgi:uncharacterized metal-binding protein